MTGSHSGGLARVLSPTEVMLLTLSALSPVLSVFIGGNAVLHLAGTGAALGFIVGALLVATFALLYAELASSFPGAGGLYPSLYALLGGRWTFPYVMLAFALTFPAVGFAALGFGSFVHSLLPAISSDIFAFAGLLLAASLAVMNIKRNSKVIALFLVIELVALAVLCGVAVHALARPLAEVLAHPVQWSDGAMVPTGSVTICLAVVTGGWMSAGANWVTYFAEDMEDAHRRIGRVVAWAGLIAGVTIAVPVVLVVLAIDDLPAVLSSATPMTTFLMRSGGPLVGSVVTVGVIVAIFNALIASIIGNSRLMYAVGRDGVFPAPISRVLSYLHPRFRSTAGATFVIVALAAGCILLGEQRLLLLITGTFWEYFLMACAVLAGRQAGLLSLRFRIPFHPLVPIIGLAMGIGVILANWTDVETGRPSMAILLGMFALAFAWHEIRVRSGRGEVELKGSDLDDPLAETDLQLQDR